MGGFDRQLARFLKSADTAHVLEIGCGEGNIIPLVKEINADCSYVASDIDPALLEQARANGADETWLIETGVQFTVPYDADSFTLVLMIEVLEHVPDPDRMLSEACRVSSSFVIASVPDEPLWRVLNLMRLKYWSRLGNTPGHTNHWGKRGFQRLLSDHLCIERFCTPFPWLMALGRIEKADD